MRCIYSRYEVGRGKTGMTRRKKGAKTINQKELYIKKLSSRQREKNEKKQK